MDIRETLITSSNTTEIQLLIEESSVLYASIEASTRELYSAFSIIEILSYFNLTFFVQHLVTFVFTKRMGRFYEFPSVLHFTDVILFCCSVVTISWINANIKNDIGTDETLSQ